MCHCALIDKWIKKKKKFLHCFFVLRWPVVDGMLKFKNCAEAEDIQSVDSEHEHDRLLVTASALNTADAEEYKRTMTHSVSSTHPKRYRH